MSDFMEIDANGIKNDFRWNELEQSYSITRTADVEPVLDYAKGLSNELGLNREGIKKGWWLYAKLPPIVIVQMRAKGIDVFNRDHQDRLFVELNSNYPYLKCTTGNVGGREKITVG